MYVATERETSDNTEATVATRFSQCAHDQRRRLEAEDCNSIRCAQLISGGRRRIRPCPPHCLAHARPTMCCIRLLSYVKEAPGVRIRHARRAGRPIPYAVRACCGAGPRPTSRPTVVDVGRETRQPIRATSRDRLSSDSLEEMEARLMSRAARMLISRATVLPGACVCW